MCSRRWCKSSVRILVGALAVLLLVGLAALPARADVRLPGFFTDHMVLQRDMPVPIWGWADPGEKVVVSLDSKTAEVTACSKGRWMVKLDSMSAGGPYVLKVSGKNTIELKDVLVGEVWLGSGQSNMAMTVGGCRDFEQEKAAADLPQIRHVTIARRPAETPQDDCVGQWQVCSPETVGGFSATAFFFGRELHRELGVPVGLINSSWGGTPVEAWAGVKAQQAHEELKPMLDDWQQRIAGFDPEKAKQQYAQALARWEEAAKKARAAGKPVPRRPRPPADMRLSAHRPGNLYNGMIAPLCPYAIRGGIWYQGESNAGRAQTYGLQLATMIRNWRADWGYEFPFAWVQLPNFQTPQSQPSEGGWALVREQMLQTLAVPKTGMAVTIELGEANNIHPKNKQDVGKRLALWALAEVYGKDIVYSGPIYKDMKREDGRIILSFDHVDGGLVAKGGKLRGFAIAGEDRQFVWAEAGIEGDTVVVSSPEVKQPVAVRYAWASNPDCNLYNKAGLPASPFRTDQWEQ